MRRVLGLTLVAACTVDLKALSPFPCGADAACPDGFSCTRLGCVAYALGVPCRKPAAGERDPCEEFGLPDGLECKTGVCVHECRSSCPNGGSCTQTSEGRVCLLDCESVGALCETGARCNGPGRCGADDGGVLPDGGTGGGADAGRTLPPGALLVFTTAETFNGDLRDQPDASTGLAGADQRCADAAIAGGLPGRFVALLARNGVDARSRLPTSGRWFLAGTLVEAFASRAQVDDKPSVVLDRDQFGERVSGHVWVGSPAGHCLQWTRTGATATAVRGTTDAPHTWFAVSPSDRGSCANLHHLYCFQVP